MLQSWPESRFSSRSRERVAVGSLGAEQTSEGEEMETEAPWEPRRPASQDRNWPTLFVIVAGKADYLGFPPQEVSVAYRHTHVVGNDITLAFTLVDCLGVAHNKEHPEAMHGDAGHQAEPAHGSDLPDAGAAVREDLHYNVYGFVEKDPDDVEHQALVLLGVYRVQEQAADDEGDARQEEDNAPAPTRDELTYQDSHTLGPLVALRALAALHVLLFKDEVHVRGYDGEDPW